MNPPAPLTPPGKGRHFITTLVLLIGVGVAICAILEGGGRYATRQREQAFLRTSPHLAWTNLHEYDAGLMWALKPNVKDAYQGFPFGGTMTTWSVSTNEEGLRNAPVAPVKNRYRILVLGDSRTYGMGVNDRETWPAQFQAELDQRHPGQYEVINAAVTGYTCVQGLNYLKRHGFDLKPDLVVVVFGYNEGAPVPPPGIGDWDWEDPRANSGFMTLIKRAVRGAGLTHQDPVTYPNTRVSPGRLVDTYMEISRQCAAHQASVVYIVWPSFPELMGEPFDRPFYCDLVREAAQQANVPAIGVIDALASAASPIFLDDIHLNAQGNQRVAGKVAADFEALVANGMKPGMLPVPRRPEPIPADPEAAVNALVRLVCINPNYVQAGGSLDNRLNALNRPDRRVAVWRDITNKVPEAGRPHFYLAQALDAQGDKEAAVEFQKAADLIPHDIALLMTVADALLRRSHPTAAAAVIGGVISNNPSADQWAHIGDLAMRAKAAGAQWKDIDDHIRKDVTLPDGLIQQLRNKLGG